MFTYHNFRPTANGIRSGGGRNLIRWRTESNWAADGIQSGGGRNPIRWRTESNQVADGRRVWHPCHTHAIYQLSSSNNATRRLRGTVGGHGIPCHTHAIYQLSSSNNATRRLRGMVGGYGIPAIPTQSINYQAVAMQQEGCVGMARMPYPPNTEKAQSCALWALLLFGRCRIRGSGSSLSTLLLEERCQDQRSHRASCRGARKT